LIHLELLRVNVKGSNLKIKRNRSPKTFNRKKRVSMTMRRTPMKTRIGKNGIKRKNLSTVRNKESSLNQRRSTIQSMTKSTILRTTIPKMKLKSKGKRRKNHQRARNIKFQTIKQNFNRTRAQHKVNLKPKRPKSKKIRPQAQIIKVTKWNEARSRILT